MNNMFLKPDILFAKILKQNKTPTSLQLDTVLSDTVDFKHAICKKMYINIIYIFSYFRYM